MMSVLSRGLLLVSLAFAQARRPEASLAISLPLDAAGNIIDMDENGAREEMLPSPDPNEKPVNEAFVEIGLLSSMGLVDYIQAAAPDKRYGRISQDVEYTTYWEELLTLPMRKPFSFNALLATVKTWLADLVVQCTEIMSGGKARLDWKRSFAFALFGFFYVGLVQWVFYVSLMAYLAPSAIVFSNEPLHDKFHDVRGQEDLLKQVMFDNLFLNAFVYFPVFYMVKEVVHSGCSNLNSLQDGLRKYRGNCVSDNMMSMLFWLPGDLIAFAAPMYMRLPLDHAVSFCWTMVLSYRRGGAGSTPKGAAGAEKRTFA